MTWLRWPLGPEAWVYIDESGSVRAGKPFTVGLFITWRDTMWRNIITRVRTRLGYTASLHLNKVSAQPTDRRLPVYLSIIDELGRAPKSWYGRTVYVDEKRADRLRKLSEVAAYDALIGSIARRFIPAIRDRRIHVVVAEKSRPLENKYLPEGLERRLNELSRRFRWGKTFDVQIRPAKSDNLLQIADLLASAEWQLQEPSSNVNKLRIAQTLFSGHTGERIGRWILRLTGQEKTDAHTGRRS